jgi:hypothetical protein
MIVGVSRLTIARSTTMAERQRMTTAEVVELLRTDEGADLVRESLGWLVRELMEAEVSELVLRLAEVDRVDRLGLHARSSLPPHCSARRR